jgi:hypothetical protein
VAGATFSFTGGYVEAAYAPDFRTVADVLAFDLKKSEAVYFNRRISWPGEPVAPLLSVRDEGHGRVAYLAAPIGALNRRAASVEIDRLLTQAVRWAAGEPPPVELLSEVPSVRMDVDWDAAQGRYIVLLTNLTLNDLREGNIRWLVPLAEIDVLVRGPGDSVRDVCTASGAAVTIVSAEDGAVIRLPKLDYFEALYISVSQKR